MDIREKMVMIMDMNGYEQDGDGLRFIDLNKGGSITFTSDEDLYRFIVTGGVNATKVN